MRRARTPVRGRRDVSAAAVPITPSGDETVTGRLVRPCRSPSPRTSCAAPSPTSSRTAATRRAVGEPDPARPDGAVHVAGMVPFKPVLPRRGGAAVHAGDLGAEVRAGRRQAQRPRRRRPHQPPPHLLRDAGQLQLRRLLQGRGDPVGVGVRHRGARPRRDRLWVTVHDTDDEAERDLARRGRRARRSASSASARTTSGRWATPARAARARRSSATCGAELRRRAAARRTAATTATSRSGTSCSCSSTSAPTATLTPLPKPSIDTGAGLERNLACCRASTRSGTPTCCVPLHRRGAVGHRHAPTAPTTSTDV